MCLLAVGRSRVRRWPQRGDHGEGWSPSPPQFNTKWSRLSPDRHDLFCFDDQHAVPPSRVRYDLKHERQQWASTGTQETHVEWFESLRDPARFPSGEEHLPPFFSRSDHPSAWVSYDLGRGRFHVNPPTVDEFNEYCDTIISRRRHLADHPA